MKSFLRWSLVNFPSGQSFRNLLNQSTISSSLKLVLSKQNFISIGFRYDPVLQNCILNLLKLYLLIQNSKLILNSVKSISQKNMYYTKMWLLYLLTNLMGSSTSVITTSSSNLEVSMFNFFKALTFSSSNPNFCPSNEKML